MASSVTIKIDPEAVSRLLTETVGPAAAGRAAGRVRDRAKVMITQAGRIDTGALRNSIVSRRVESSSKSKVWFEVGSSLPYAIYQHNGVKGPIRPKRAKVLRFKPKGSSSYVFAPSVAGFRGVPYLTQPLNELTPADFGKSA